MRTHPLDIDLHAFVEHTLEPVSDLLVALHLDTCGTCRMKWVRLHRAEHQREPEPREYERAATTPREDVCPTCGSDDPALIDVPCDPENGGVFQDPWHLVEGKEPR